MVQAVDGMVLYKIVIKLMPSIRKPSISTPPHNKMSVSSRDSDTYDAAGEAGVMDYRYNEIKIEQLEDKYIVRLTFSFIMHYSCDTEVSDGFEARWCERHSADEVAADIYDIADTSNARWVDSTEEEGKKVLEFEIARDEDGYLPTEEDIYDELIFNRLEDSVYDSLPGKSFWVVSEMDL
jgi:hypothetical protein